MSATIAVQPAAQHSSPPTRSQLEHPRNGASPPQFARTLAPPSSSGNDRRNSAAIPATSRHPAPHSNKSSRSPGDEPIHLPARMPASRDKVSPANAPASRHGSGSVDKDTAQPRIKQERSSPRPVSPTPPSRHRPRRLDLSKDPSRPGAPLPSAPLNSAGLGTMHDVGIACLSPGFASNDPAVRQQLQRSLDLREQQRQIIAERQREKDGMVEPALPSSTFARAPTSSRRKGPPPGLSIHAPSARQFDNEPRVVQSAPLHQSFTGLRPGPGHVHPLSRQVLDRNNAAPQRPEPSTEQQNSNRLPPIHDVFASQGMDSNDRRGSGQPTRNDSNSHFAAPARSPGLHPPPPPPAQQSSPRLQYAPIRSPGLRPPPASAGLAPPPRSRDFSSADEAVHTLAGGREELLPKLVHYGGHQPPTPPSPLPSNQTHLRPAEQSIRRLSAPNASISHAGQRRSRDEYERDYHDGGLGWEEERRRAEKAAERGPFGAGRDSPETQRRKKERFMSICAEAWDLFHS